MKEHLTDEGLEKIVALKASMNLGLSQKLKFAFSHVVPINRPIVKTPDNFTPNGVAWFASAEGCFMIRIKKSQTGPGGADLDFPFIWYII